MFVANTWSWSQLLKRTELVHRKAVHPVAVGLAENHKNNSRDSRNQSGHVTQKKMDWIGLLQLNPNNLGKLRPWFLTVSPISPLSNHDPCPRHSHSVAEWLPYARVHSKRNTSSMLCHHIADMDTFHKRQRLNCQPWLKKRLEHLNHGGWFKREVLLLPRETKWKKYSHSITKHHQKVLW